MSPETIIDDEAYASSEDPDFSPDNAPDRASSAESEDDETEAVVAAAKRKRERDARGDAEAEDAGFENSGDEAVIGKGKKSHRRYREGAVGDVEDGEGVVAFVKTRSQRANEKAERRAAAVRGPVTVDVDALWKDMMGEPSDSHHNELSSLATAAMAAAVGDEPGDVKEGAAGATATAESEIIKIKRTYNFAGKLHIEEKLVARDSTEAKLYLAEVGADGTEGVEASCEDGQLKRLPPRKAFHSAFEPILDHSLVQVGVAGLARRTDLDLGVAARLQARERAAQQEHAKKLNTVEKSRMDWAGFVDREGIQDELVLAGKSKGAFVDRQQFLMRTEIRREEEARRARLTGKV